MVVDTFVSDRVLQKITEFNEKARMNATAKKPFKPIEVSEDGLELIEYLSLDCSAPRENGTRTVKLKLIKTAMSSATVRKPKNSGMGPFTVKRNPFV